MDNSPLEGAIILVSRTLVWVLVTQASSVKIGCLPASTRSFSFGLLALIKGPAN